MGYVDNAKSSFYLFRNWITRILRLRRTDAPPSALEVFLPTAAWSVLFEVVLPLLSPRFTADPWDMNCYVAGALAAHTLWNGRKS